MFCISGVDKFMLKMFCLESDEYLNYIVKTMSVNCLNTKVHERLFR